MEKIYIIVVDDQREVLTTVSNDLDELAEHVTIEECESPSEAWEILEEVDAEGQLPAVVISDHVMPVKTGVEFLSELSEDARFGEVRKVLLTGLATHTDTINAINQASIHRYVEKPWDKTELVEMVKILITEYLLEKGINYEPYNDVLDHPTLLKYLRDQT